MYKTLNLQNGRKKTDLISHHDFRKCIALCWINPEEYSNESESGTKCSFLSTNSDITRQGWRRKKQSDKAASVSSLSTYYNGVIQVKKSRACTVSDTSLLHSSSLSGTRLNTSLDHIDNIGKPYPRCALHKWLGYETEKDVHYCSSDNTNLCVCCNRFFHTVSNTISMRDSLKKQYKNKNK